MVRLTFALLSAVVGGCQAAPREAVATPPYSRTTLEALFSLGGSAQDFERCIVVLQKANVRSDIAEAHRLGDRRLIAIMGLALEVPGVPAFAHGEPPVGYTAVPVRGTSDAIRSNEQYRCQSMLYLYAEQYNRGVLEPQQVPPNDALQRTRPAQATEPRR